WDFRDPDRRRSSGCLSELLSESYSRRKQQWLEQLAELVSELQDRVADLSEPPNSDRHASASRGQAACPAERGSKLSAEVCARRRSPTYVLEVCPRLHSVAYPHTC